MQDTTSLLRFSTAGSVDDGKSTLIGRLLYDSKSILEDQLVAVERSTKRRGMDGIDLSLLTDGLIAEREQGITIDVAYRYFSTPKRKFIIADTPGHEQYTRNMVTGASTADLAVVLVDASRGISLQSRRHAVIAHLLGIEHVVIAINKMDLVGYSKEAFEAIRQPFAEFCAQLGIVDPHFVPLSALQGDMVVERGNSLDWYSGPTLLELLETSETDRTLAGELRFPVQLVSRPTIDGRSNWRGYMGRVESGTVNVGDAVTILPSGLTTQIEDIITLDGRLYEAKAPQSVTLLLRDDLDISRGDMITHAHGQPQVVRALDANVCWMDAEPLVLGRRYLVKSTTRTVKAVFGEVKHRIDVESLNEVDANGALRLNDIGHVTLKLQQPLVVDPYRDNRATGSFVVIDETTNHTVAAGMVR